MYKTTRRTSRVGEISRAVELGGKMSGIVTINKSDIKELEEHVRETLNQLNIETFNCDHCFTDVIEFEIKEALNIIKKIKKGEK